jgi:hypothetical protein
VTEYILKRALGEKMKALLLLYNIT